MTQIFAFSKYALVVCRSHHNKYLCIQQKNGLWWIVGGSVQKSQTFRQAAIRQAKQEAGIDITLKGMFGFDTFSIKQNNSLRTVFYAQPVDHNQQPKQKSDKQSKKAAYLTLEQILQLKPQWRFAQIYNYPSYLQKGGQIYPLELLQQL